MLWHLCIPHVLYEVDCVQDELLHLDGGKRDWLVVIALGDVADDFCFLDRLDGAVSEVEGGPMAYRIGSGFFFLTDILRLIILRYIERR